MSGYRHDDCAICGTEIGYSEVAEKLPSGLLRCSGCSIEAARIDSLANRNDRAVIDDFLARVKKRWVSMCNTDIDHSLGALYLKARDEVYAEMFGGKKYE